MAGTVISSAAVNSDLADVATALTGSFARDGQSPMLGQFKALDGSLLAPGLSFSNETNTGFTRPGAGQIGAVILGTQVSLFSSTGIAGNFAGTFTGTFVGLPTMTASSDWFDDTQSKIMLTDKMNATGAFVSLTDAATIAWDNRTGINFTVTIGASRTLGNMTNPVVGRSGMLEVIEGGAGGFTLSLGTNYKTDVGGGFSIDTVAGRKNGILYFVRSATEVWLSLPFKGVR